MKFLLTLTSGQKIIIGNEDICCNSIGDFISQNFFRDNHSIIWFGCNSKKYINIDNIETIEEFG